MAAEQPGTWHVSLLGLAFAILLVVRIAHALHP
jgi:hypothetical protein